MTEATGCAGERHGATLVIFEDGMTYSRAVEVAGGTLPQQHAHVVPVRTVEEWGALSG